MKLKTTILATFAALLMTACGSGDTPSIAADENQSGAIDPIGSDKNSSAYVDPCSIKNCPEDSKFVSISTATIEKPAFLESYIEPQFNTKVTRMTDRASQSGNAHIYSKVEAWNSDMTLIRLGYRLYDAKTFEESTIINKNKLDYNIRGLTSEMRWSSKDPHAFFAITRGAEKFHFIRASFNNGEISNNKLASFSKDVYDELYMGKYEGNIDNNDQYVVFAGRKKGKNFVTAIVYDIENNQILKKDLTNITWYKEDEDGQFIVSSAQSNQSFDWISISPLGNSILLSWAEEPKNENSSIRGAIYQYDNKINFIRKLADHASHGDIGVDKNDKEVYVQFGFGYDREGELNTAIWLYPLDGSKRKKLLPSKYNGGHISCRNRQRKGWCYMSAHKKGFREVLAVKLDGSGTVNRFAQTHDSDNFSSLVNVSPDGTELLFRSDWGNTSNIDETYHVKMP